MASTSATETAKGPGSRKVAEVTSVPRPDPVGLPGDAGQGDPGIGRTGQAVGASDRQVVVASEEGVEAEGLRRLGDRQQLVVGGTLLGLGEDSQEHAPCLAEGRPTANRYRRAGGRARGRSVSDPTGRPTATTPTTRAPAIRRAAAALCARAPVVTLSSKTSTFWSLSQARSTAGDDGEAIPGGTQVPGDLGSALQQRSGGARSQLRAPGRPPRRPGRPPGRSEDGTVTTTSHPDPKRRKSRTRLAASHGATNRANAVAYIWRASATGASL